MTVPSRNPPQPSNSVPVLVVSKLHCIVIIVIIIIRSSSNSSSSNSSISSDI
jgi:hypothetical protein